MRRKRTLTMIMKMPMRNATTMMTSHPLCTEDQRWHRVSGIPCTVPDARHSASGHTQNLPRLHCSQTWHTQQVILQIDMKTHPAHLCLFFTRNLPRLHCNQTWWHTHFIFVLLRNKHIPSSYLFLTQVNNLVQRPESARVTLQSHMITHPKTYLCFSPEIYPSYTAVTHIMITHPTTYLCFPPEIYPGYTAVTHDHTPNNTTLFLTRNLPTLHCSHTWSHTQQRIFVSHPKSTLFTLQSSVISYPVYGCCTFKIYPGYTAIKRDLLPCLC